MKFPEKYDTQLKARGALLIDAQKQPISIARFLIRDPNILILDISTVAPDSNSVHVDHVFKKKNAGRLTIITGNLCITTVLQCGRDHCVGKWGICGTGVT